MNPPTTGDLNDFLRGELSPADEVSVRAWLESDSGGPARAELARLEKLIGLVTDATEIEPSANRLELQLDSAFDQRARRLGRLIRESSSITPSRSLIRRIDRSVMDAASEPDSPVVSALVEALLAKDHRRAAEIVANYPGVSDIRHELEAMIGAIGATEAPEEARRRVSARLHATVARELPLVRKIQVGGLPTVQLPELAVSAALKQRVGRSIEAERVVGENRRVSEPDWLAGMPEIRARARRLSRTPSLSLWQRVREKARVSAFAIALHMVALIASMMVVTQTAGQPAQPMSEISAQTMTEWRAPSPLPIVAESSASPLDREAVAAVSLDGIRPVVTEAPTDGEPSAWDPVTSIKSAERSDQATEAEVNLYDAMLLSQGLAGTGARVPADSASSAAWFSIRRGPRIAKSRYLPEGQPWFERLDQMLAWLVRNQQANGAWPVDPGPVASRGPWDLPARQVVTTSVALLALMGDGYSAINDTPSQSVARGLAWLTSQQNSSGGFVSVQRDGQLIPQDTMLADAIAALALAEGHALSGDRSSVEGRDLQLRTPMRRALARVLAGQLKEGSEQGGWPAGSSPQADPVTTAWAVQALMAAKAHRWNHPMLEPALKQAAEWTERTTEEEDPAYGGFAGVLSRPGDDPMVLNSGERAVGAGTSASMLTGMMLELKGAKDRRVSQLDFLSRDEYLPSFASFGGPGQRFYRVSWSAWFFAASACHSAPEEPGAVAWLAKLHAELGGQGLPMEANSGVAPIGEEERAMGRAYSTAMAALCIESAWRWRR